MALYKHIPLVAVHILIFGAAWAMANFGGGLSTAGLGTLLIWISCRDIAVLEVPDVAVVLLVVGGIAIAPDPVRAAVAATLWGALYLAIRYAARAALGQEALGLGDVKLMAGLAVWLGPVAPIYVTLCASVAAIVTMLAFALVKRENLSEIRGTGIAFGPFLCVSAWGNLLWGTGL